MVLSKRERFISIATAAVIGILLLDYLMVEPMLQQRKDLAAQILKHQEELHRAKQLIYNSRGMTGIWSELSRGQLLRNPSEAESQLAHSVDEWAHDAGLNLASSRATATAERENGFNKITVRATGNGGIAQIARFLWRVQTASIPVRATGPLVTRDKAGTDALTVPVAVSTIQQSAGRLSAGASSGGEPEAPPRASCW